MVELALIVNKIMGLSMIASHLLLLVFIGSIVYVKFFKKELPKFLQDIWEFVKERALLLAFLMAFAGVFGSLVYSEIVAIPPCDLCWFQRAMIYPQAIFLGIALWKKQRDVFDYVLGLNIVGLIFGVYQYVMQMVGYTGPCPIGSGSCFGKEVFEFGYITIPLMSITLMIFIIILTYIWKRNSKKGEIKEERGEKSIFDTKEESDEGSEESKY